MADTEKKTNEMPEGFEKGPDGKPMMVAQNVEPGEKMVVVKLPLTKEQDKDVFVRVNQRTWNIKRGVYVIPQCAAEVLEHAESATLAAIEFQKANEKGS